MTKHSQASVSIGQLVLSTDAVLQTADAVLQPADADPQLTDSDTDEDILTRITKHIIKIDYTVGVCYESLQVCKH